MEAGGQENGRRSDGAAQWTISEIVITENSGANQVIYTATADDSQDISGGVTFSLKDVVDGLSIDARSGEVTLSHNPDADQSQDYSFTVVATDASGLSVEQAVGVVIEASNSVEVSYWNGGVGITDAEISFAGESNTQKTDISGRVAFADLNESISISKEATALDISSITVSDALKALELSVRDDVALDDIQGSAANVDGNLNDYGYQDISITDVLAILKFSAYKNSETFIENNSTDLGNWKFVDGHSTDSNDSYSSVGYLVGDVDGSWGTYSARNSSEKEVAVHVDETKQQGEAVFTFDPRAMEVSSRDSGLRVEGNQITLANNADYETSPTLSFTLRDKATGEILVHNVEVRNIDDTAPEFKSSNATASIQDHDSVGKVIFTAVADDSRDSRATLENKAGVKYQLQDTDGPFAIDSATGEVTLTEDVNMESLPSFTVIAMDERGNSSVQTVNLVVNNVDEAAPVIGGIGAESIEENSGAGQEIYDAGFMTHDNDDHSDGYSFSLSEGSDSSLVINANTGVVTLLADPDFEAQSAYKFTVVVTDEAGNSSEKTVSIDVNDLDERAPMVVSGGKGAIDESASADTVIYTAEARDFGAVKGGITYHLGGEDAGELTIDSATGAVSLLNDADFSSHSAYSFTVTAKDAADNESAAKQVTIKVNNLDETAPTIDSVDSVNSIDENSGANQVIYTAVADDSLDTSAGIKFSLTDDSDSALVINAKTGEVVLTENPDFESQASYSFTVVAVDRAGNESSPKALTLEINNLDDTAPGINSDIVAASVDENSGAGQVVYTAAADDSADVSGGVTFILGEGSDSALSIHATSGEVTLADNPNHEIQSEYSFTVIATDIAGNATKQAVSLTINDIDDIAPVITSDEAAVAIVENSGAGQVIYTAQAEDYDQADNAGGLIYSLAGADAAAFTIDSASGAVTLVNDPDFESQNSYSFEVVAADAAGNASAQTVSLAIKNADEVGPSFSSGDSLSITIDENSGHDQLIYTAQASDADDQNADSGIVYSLIDAPQGIAINKKTGEVFLMANPDADEAGAASQLSLSFTVVATDRNSEQTAEQEVTLKINNFDDTAPTFASDAHGDLIVENSGSNQVVYTAIANDDDDVSSGLIYKLSDDADPALSINPISGEVTLTSNPNYEAKDKYSFTVIAKDAAGNISEQSVTFDVENIDEIAPTITSGATAAAIDENSIAGQVIYTISANDMDLDGGILTYEVVGDNALSVDANGQVILSHSPDFEVQSSYNFTVYASDGRNVSQGKNVTVSVVNQDDTAPTVSSLDQAMVVENSGAGQVIYTASANDSADVSDGDITFAISGVDANALTIDAETGEVSLTDNPDYEAKQQYSFEVTATDAAGNTSVTKSVSLNVMDVLDTEPVFGPIDPTPIDSIDENSGAGQSIFSVSGGQPGLVFSLIGDNALAIDDETGEVTLNPNPDYEAQSSYSYTVIATDADGVEVLNESHSLLINDVDDTAATINSGSGADAIDENSGSGQVIYVAETDEAEGITFSLAGYSDAGLAINSETGEVTLNPNPDFESQGQYSFTVIATDAAGNASQQSVTLDINNLDDAAPTITSGTVANTIDEDSGAGQLVYTATADDSADISDGVTFSLAGADVAAFTIDGASGAVTLTANPDFEAQSSYSFEVVASDGVNQTSKTVSLDVNNIDDSDPVITSELDAFVEENSGAGQVVYTATADDSADISGGVTFGLSDDSDNSLSINPISGEVVLADNPDYESQSSYDFTIIATDAADNTSEQPGTLYVDNIDDSDPSITSGNSAVPVDENSGAGQVIYTAMASDESDVTFSLAAGSDNALSINPITGEVTLAFDPNFEAKDQYDFTVVATDAVGNSTEQEVTLDITNLDEAAPEFVSADSTVVYTNGTGVFYTAQATDADSVNDSPVTYSLSLDSAQYFGIDSLSGDITVESQDALPESLEVIATDGSNNSSSQTVELLHREIVSGGEPMLVGNLGAIDQRFVQNADGSMSLQLLASANQGLIENMDFVVTYTPGDLDGGQFISTSSPSPFSMSNDSGAGAVEVSQFFFPQLFDPSTGEAVMELTFELASGVTSTLFTVENVLFNSDSDYAASTTYEYKDVTEVVGDDGSDVYILKAGLANVESQGGNDIFEVTTLVDEGVTIDFESGADSIDIGQLIAAAGHESIDDLSQISMSTPDLADLISEEDSLLEGHYGASLGDDNILTLFVSNGETESVDFNVYKVSLADGSTFEDDDLTASYDAFNNSENIA